ncbi:uncharacterized protein LOC8080468 [Sorghum bicolor]|uniref:uncharacterized protein LOC8080468 n=1 Tax=Sorghum bicolor TaxID=4558 RepID=UPI000B4236D5|nr:uncharacterized protein LOC8080468 [Sorghum bicolor]|eukprot:XP_002465195.2 uncharacterized protein LOC8080468 [Sorghum bicolor]
METAISAVIGEVVSQFISFLMSKYSNNAASEEQKMGRLQHLLLRVRTVVEEADGRHITNSGMVEQLQVLADAMYRGYRLLDSFSCGGRPNNPLMMEEVKVSNTSASLSLQSPRPKRCRTITLGRKGKAVIDLDQSSLDETLDRLETAAAHMAEFVVLLGGCERLSRRPYDAHLYIDNFMFGRHAEKQRLLNFLLDQNNSATGSPPPVLSVIGGPSVGKRTLVAHVCSDKRVTSHFSLILHLNEGDLFRVQEEHESRRAAEGKVLIVVEFDSVVDEEDWVKFYSSVTNLKKGSKVVIISNLRKFDTFATVKPIFLSTLPYAEFRYLFKILAFGSTNPMEHPQLLKIVDELSKELQLGWSLVTANALGEALRTNLDRQPTFASFLDSPFPDRLPDRNQTHPFRTQPASQPTEVLSPPPAGDDHSASRAPSRHQDCLAARPPRWLGEHPAQRTRWSRAQDLVAREHRAGRSVLLSHAMAVMLSLPVCVR